MIALLFELSRRNKRLVSIFADLLFLPFAFWLSMSLIQGRIFWPDQNTFYMAMAATAVVSIAAFIRLGLYRAVIRYMSNHALVAVVTGVSISATVLALSGLFYGAPIPPSVWLIYWCLALLFVGGSRMTIRFIFQHQMMKSKERVIIYGSGSSGIQLSSVLYQGNQFQPVAFIDDDSRRLGNILNGLRVYPTVHMARTIEKYGAKRILLALDNTPRSRRNLILRFLEDLPVQVQTIPSMSDIVSGKSTIAEVRDVDIEDLLGRDEVVPDNSLIKRCITGKVVMVTGAGGSIGAELCRQLVEHEPMRLVLFELSEYALYRIEQELSKAIETRKLSVELVTVLGSVQKEHRVEVIMHTFGVQTVYHAAAYKHVPMVEHNIVEGVRNNVFGTWYCAEAAIRAGVESFILVSTDKAVRPTNIMGASKRMAELVLQGLAERQSKTRFCMVRFGNVLGSSGSVVPLFREQIRKGGPVTVTNKNITRYFMTIPEAAQLVLQAGSMSSGGEVFVLEMGSPIKIDDLARKMIHLMGYEVKDDIHPDGDIEISYTGLRAGEKLFEETLIGGNPMGTEHGRIMKAQETFLPWEELKALLDEMDRACHTFDCERVRQLLVSAPTDYQPRNENQDLVWQQNRLLETRSNKVKVLKPVKKEGVA
ncbi:MAG: nucleoside-diphosphate sugar epimerase [Proteobacteria bacterium]|nr:MAG: nucleoside-diphosphate sugar epimerase [Pseudomonadota bacterium]PIE39878.1 MAG: nucleoside-diphosphate sugar epimerase [Gammaproteobacteria bacterium]